MRFMRFIAPLFLTTHFVSAAVADEFPFIGVWAAIDKNFPGTERKACEAARKFGLENLSGNTIGEIVAFTGKKRLDFGGYMDTGSVHLSSSRQSDGGVSFRDRRYDDGEESGAVGFRAKNYVVKIVDPMKIEIKDRYGSIQYLKCWSATVQDMARFDNPLSVQGAELKRANSPIVSSKARPAARDTGDLTSAYQSSCELANILFGKVRLEIISHESSIGKYESAIIKGNDFDSKKFGYGYLLGEVTVDRGSFAIRNSKSEVIGVILPNLEVDAWGGNTCDKNAKVIFHKVKSGVYVLMNGDLVVGTLEGRFPSNTFGVK